MAQTIVVIAYGTRRDDSNVTCTDYDPVRHRDKVKAYLVTASAAGWFAIQRDRIEGGTELFMERREGDAPCPPPAV